LAKFGKPTGAATTGFDAGSTTQVVRVGNTTTVALFDGDGLQVDIANNAVASITESTEKSSSMRSFAISGTGAGHAKLEAKDASGVVQASMTIQATTGATYAELLADYQPSDAAKQNLSSDELARLREAVEDLRANQPPSVDLQSEKFSATDMVKTGESRPPNWHTKK
jgi:hypothetical protein